MVAGEIHAGDDVGNLLGAQHRKRVSSEHSVVNGTRLVEALSPATSTGPRTCSRRDPTLTEVAVPLDGCVSIADLALQSSIAGERVVCCRDLAVASSARRSASFAGTTRTETRPA